MAVNISFDADTGKIRRSNGTFLENVPAIEKRVAERFAQDLEEAVKESVRQKFDRFSGDLHDNVDAHQKGSTAGGTKFEVTANAYNSEGVNYAAWHEYASTSHFVPLETNGVPNEPINTWAKMKGLDVGGVTVTPINQQEGSFMAPAVREAIKKARRRMRSGRNAASTGLQAAFQG